MPAAIRAPQRSRRVFDALVSAVFGKGLVLVVNAVSIPLAMHYLGAEMFGVWMTISTTLTLLLILDLGIASSLTNLISEAFARENRELAAMSFTAAFWMMVLLAGALAMAGRVIYPVLSWTHLFHLSSASAAEAAHATVAAFVVFLFGLPAGLAAKVLGGYQELRAGNIFAAAGNIVGLASLTLVIALHGSVAWVIASSSGSVVLANYCCLLWIWTRHKPWLVPLPRHLNLSAASRILTGGSDLFILQLAGLIVFNSDNFVIAHYLGAVQVTPYSVTWKLVGYAAALQVLITPALWPAYAEAYVRGDLEWMRRTVKLVMAATMSVAAGSCAILMFAGRAIIKAWAGAAAVPPQRLVAAMCVWILISTFMANTSTVLLATGKTGMQAWLSVTAAAVNLWLSILWVQRIGSLGVILATITSYILVLAGPQTWKVLRVLAVDLRRPRSKNA